MNQWYAGLLTVRQYACHPCPKINQSDDPRTKSEGVNRKTVAGAKPWEEFDADLASAIKELDDTRPAVSVSTHHHFVDANYGCKLGELWGSATILRKWSNIQFWLRCCSSEVLLYKRVPNDPKHLEGAASSELQQCRTNSFLEACTILDLPASNP